MFEFLKRQFSKYRTGGENWGPLYPGRTEGFQSDRARKPGVISPDLALTLSPVWAALKLYQTQIASLPLITYRTDDQGGRTEATTHPAYKVLKYTPNPAQTRSTFWERVLHDYFLHGEAFIQVRWRNNQNVLGLYPIPAGDVTTVEIDEDWNKTYKVTGHPEPLEGADVIHLIHTADRTGMRGVSLLRWAAQNLGLHRQVLESGTAFYKNAARPSGWIKAAKKPTPEALENVKTDFKDRYQGTANTGEIPYLYGGDEFVPIDTATAEDARIIEALSNVTDVARWFQLSPLLLADLSRGTYSNLGAENTALYQRSIRPVLDKFELGINGCIFGAGSPTFAEFDLDELLRGDPLMTAQVYQIYVQMGVVTRNEVRTEISRAPLLGLDTPLYPLNQGPAMAGQTPAPTAPTVPTVPNQEGGTNGVSVNPAGQPNAV